MTVEHVRIAAWLAEARARGQELSARELTRRLYPEKTPGGRLTVQVGELLKQVEALLPVPCSPVPEVVKSVESEELEQRDAEQMPLDEALGSL